MRKMYAGVYQLYIFLSFKISSFSKIFPVEFKPSAKDAIFPESLGKNLVLGIVDNLWNTTNTIIKIIGEYFFKSGFI